MLLLTIRTPVNIGAYVKVFLKTSYQKVYATQTWALTLFFQVLSPLIFYLWIAIALSLILPIFRFAHRSIALRKTSGSLLEKSAKTLDRS